jgi:hypothetical protein
MSLFDINTGMIHMDLVPFKEPQERAGVEAIYIDDSPCKTCPKRVNCMIECDDFEKYVDPLKYERKIRKYIIQKMKKLARLQNV